MQHSFAMTHEYAIIFDPPWWIDFEYLGMFFRNVQLADMIKNDVHGTTKVHVVRLSDGEVTTIDSGIWSLVLHFGNAYKIDEDTIVVEGPAYEKSNDNPFEIFDRGHLTCADDVLQKERGSVYKKFIINLKEKTVKSEDLIYSKYGSFDLPAYNTKWNGVKKQRFTYLMQLMHQDNLDADYHWPIHKYDDDLKKIVASFGAPGTTCQEPRFIANPEGTEEEDGIILTTVTDFFNKKSSLVVIDPKTMTALQEYEYPFRLAIQFHNNFFPHEKSTQ